KHINRLGDKVLPQEVLLVLDSYRRQKRYAEAYALCEQMWSERKCRPEVCGGASVAVLRMMNATDHQVQGLEDRIKEAIRKNEDLKIKSTVLFLHLADLNDLRGRYAEAEKLYAKVLEDGNEPNNVVALNNRAWLLAHRENGAGDALAAIEKAIDGIGRR